MPAIIVQINRFQQIVFVASLPITFFLLPAAALHVSDLVYVFISRCCYLEFVATVQLAITFGLPFLLPDQFLG